MRRRFRHRADSRITDPQRRVCRIHRNGAQRPRMNVAMANVQKLVRADFRRPARGAFQSGICSRSIEAKQQAAVAYLPGQNLFRSRGFEMPQEARAQRRFLQHVQQAGHWPAMTDFGLQRKKTGRLRQWVKGGDGYPPVWRKSEAKNPQTT